MVFEKRRDIEPRASAFIALNSWREGLVATIGMGPSGITRASGVKGAQKESQAWSKNTLEVTKHITCQTDHSAVAITGRVSKTRVLLSPIRPQACPNRRIGPLASLFWSLGALSTRGVTACVDFPLALSLEVSLGLLTDGDVSVSVIWGNAIGWGRRMGN